MHNLLICLLHSNRPPFKIQTTQVLSLKFIVDEAQRIFEIPKTHHIHLLRKDPDWDNQLLYVRTADDIQMKEQIWIEGKLLRCDSIYEIFIYLFIVFSKNK